MKMVAFLGTGAYKPCQYKFSGNLSGVVTFAQTAVRKFIPEITECLLFCTKEAADKHWNAVVNEFEGYHLPRPTKIDIPSGSSENELWEIFNIVCSVVKPGDELVFDVTHSFRSLPIVMTVLINYLGTLRGVKLRGCYYGAFEQLGIAKEVEAKYPNPADRQAEIFDLTGFFTLNDWTRVIGDFRRYGTAKELEDVVGRELSRQARDGDNVDRIKEAVACVQEFCECTRLGNLVKLSQLDIPGRILSNVGDDVCKLAAFKEVFVQLKDSFAEFGEDEISDGIRAARWAAGHELIPQAFTMLEETLVTYGVRLYEKLETKPEVVKCDHDKRVYVAAVLGHWNPKKPEKWDTVACGAVEHARQMGELLGKELTSCGKEIIKRRNELNHAGINRKEHLGSTADAIRRFNDSYEQVQSILSKGD